MGFKAEAISESVIDVYSENTGTIPFKLTNQDTTGFITGNLIFGGVPETEGFAVGWYKTQISGNIAATPYELEINGVDIFNVFTWANLVTTEDQLFFPITVNNNLTKLDINSWGNPKKKDTVLLDGTVIDFSGNGNNGAILNNPAGTFAISDTLTFTASLPYTQPTDVTINEGTAAGSYSSGVFTISTAGTIESLTVDGVTVYICSNVGLSQYFNFNNTRYKINFSSITWTTQNNNAFIQSKGGTFYKNIFSGTNTLGSTVINAQDVFLEIGFTPYLHLEAANAVKNFAADTTIFAAFGVSSVTGYLSFLSNGQFQYRFNGGTFTTGGAGLSAVIMESLSGVPLTFRVIRDKTGGSDNLILTIIKDSDSSVVITETFDLTLTGNDTGTYSLQNFIGVGTSVTDITVYSDSGLTTITNAWNSSNNLWSTSTGVINFSTTNIGNGAIPTALDSSGNSTGFDALGNALPTGYGQRLFDFGNSLEWKIPSVTETYGDLPPPNSAPNEFGSENQISKAGFFFSQAGFSASVQTQILQILANSEFSAPLIIEPPLLYNLQVVDSGLNPIQNATVQVGNEIRISDVNGYVFIHPILGNAIVTAESYNTTNFEFNFTSNPTGIIQLTLEQVSCINLEPINNFNFLRWHRIGYSLPFSEEITLCNTNNQPIANPFKQIDCKAYTPVISPTENFNFWANIEGGIIDADFSDWRLAVFTLSNPTVFNLDGVTTIQRHFLNGSITNYQFYINNIEFPELNNGVYYFLIYNNVTQRTKFISNPFRVLNNEVDKVTTKIRYQHDRDLYNFPYSEAEIVNEIRIHIFSNPRPTPFEANITQYKAITTGKVRISRNSPDKVDDFQSWKFDDKAHEALFTALLHRETYFNNKRYMIAEGASYELTDPSKLSPLSDGKFSAYDYDFSRVNK